jgi:DNA end-binding protein Ku
MLSRRLTLPRSNWKGTVSFGMVSIPVKLYVAQDSKSLSFRTLCKQHKQPIKNRRWCPAGDHEAEETVRGYEWGKDQYVVVEDPDLEGLPLPSARAINITEFVPRGEINLALLSKSAYYLEPEKMGAKPYALLRQALKETERIAIGKLALTNREHLAAITPLDGALMVNTLYWPDEIRSSQELSFPAESEVNDKELKMAVMLVESMTDEFSPDRYQDEYRQALEQVIQAKVEGQPLVRVEEAGPSGKVVDLMEALRASLDQAKAERGKPAAGAVKAEKAEAAEERPARKRKTA